MVGARRRSTSELPTDSGWWPQRAKPQGHRPSTPASGTKNGDKLLTVLWSKVDSSGEMAFHGFKENITRIMIIIPISCLD